MNVSWSEERKLTSDGWTKGNGQTSFMMGWKVDGADERGIEKSLVARCKRKYGNRLIIYFLP